MIELGQWLREAREAKGLSLAQVEEATRIRQKYLAALESGRREELPGDVPTRGFLRNYALYLGLNPDEAIQRLGQPLSEVAQIAKAAEQTMGPRAVDYRPITVELHDEAPVALRSLSLGLLVGLIVILAAVGYYIWRNNPTLLTGLFAPPPTATPTIVATTAVSTITPTDTPNAFRITATPTAGIFLLPTPTPTATPIPTAAPTATPTPPIVEMNVVLRAVQRAWVRVVADGETKLEKILEAGAQELWTAQSQFTVRTGNAAGVTVIVNDEDQGVLGSAGAIEECIWTLNSGEVTRTCSGDVSTGTVTATRAVTQTPTASPTATRPGN